MSDPLTIFLREAARSAFSWERQSDCLMWLADWMRVKRGIDPGVPWRGAYRTALGAMRIVTEAGGMVALVEKGLAPFGILRTETPHRGDIAIVDLAGAATGAIVLGKSCAMLGPRGIVIGRAPLVAAWAL
jgi:hypothetical protein